MSGSPRARAWPWAMSGLLPGLAVGCLLELEHRLACGDGLVDTAAGEQCDPQDAASPHLTACVELNYGQGQGLCDDECRIVVNKNICAACGDGIAAGLEECDGDDLRGQACPSGEGALACTDACDLDRSACEPCGDAIVQSPEECDVRHCGLDGDCEGSKICDPGTKTCIAPGEITVSVDCEDLAVTASLPDKDQYARGAVRSDDCASQCFYDRRHCDFCGDEIVDGQYEDQGATGAFVQKSEVCDGPSASGPALADHCNDVCTEGLGTSLHLRCDFECEDDCSGFRDTVWEDPVLESARCCVVGGSPCDVPNGIPCCWELDFPEADPEDACVEIITQEGIQRQCNSSPPMG